MTAKIVEVLAKILEGLKDNYSIEEVTRHLNTNKDFDEQTVSAALGLVFDKYLTKRMILQKQGNSDLKSFRVLTNEEINIIHTHHRMAAFYVSIIKKNKKILSYYFLLKKPYVAIGLIYAC